ncbi:MAG: thiol:disulfide interchange protein DsbA/DsbL [Legionella sp.]|nr:thiol:disulfide interchange protein DsbA/DsbL [Legionella sp.]
MLRRFFLILCLIPMMAFAEDFVAGKDYEVISGVTDKPTGAAVSVTEFFSYGCPWCYKIEPLLSQWVTAQDQKIQFNRVPVVFNKEWTYYAKAYYAADILGLGSKLNPLLFKAIQTDKQTLTSNQAMIDFFVAHGVDKETAESAFTHSTTIDMKVKEGNVIMGRFHINAVPAIIVNNQYKTDLQMAKGEERLFKVLDFLVAKAHKNS